VTAIRLREKMMADFIAAESIRAALVWRSLREESPCLYRSHRVQALTPPDHRVSVVFCLWLFAKCVVNTQFVAKILFTDEAEFTRDDIVVWVDDNPHATLA
jgi:hypothetical protein